MKKTRHQKSHATVPLKGLSHEIFWCLCFHQTSPPGPIRQFIKPFFKKYFHGVLKRFTGVQDTRDLQFSGIWDTGKSRIASVPDTGFMGFTVMIKFPASQTRANCELPVSGMLGIANSGVRDAGCWGNAISGVLDTGKS